MLCESSVSLLLTEEQLKLLSATMLVGIHNLSHCSNIIPEAADMWQAGEHLNTVVLCDRSCRTEKLTGNPRNNPRPFTWYHGKISCSCVIPDKYLFNLLLQTTQKPWFHSIHSGLFPCIPFLPFRSTWVYCPWMVHAPWALWTQGSWSFSNGCLCICVSWCFLEVSCLPG